MDGLSAKPRPPVAHLRAAKARHRGCVLFGYFLLHKQEKVTRPPGRRAEKHTDVSRSSRRHRQSRRNWIPAFAGMTTVRATRSPGGRAEKHRDVSRSSRQRPKIKNRSGGLKPTL